VNTVCFDVDVRNSGTADGRHVVPPTHRNPTSNNGGTE
jgi:hypothetical protein